MTTVYVVTDGCYSDSHIVAVYTTKETAQKMVDKLGEDAEIEEFILDEMAPDKTLYGVSMNRDGDILRIDKLEGRYAIYSTGIKIARGFYVTVSADDLSHAIKIANEKRTMFYDNNRAHDSLTDT